MYSPWRDRVLIDYCQYLTEQGLLQRSDGVPFLGEGEKYWSVIDDPEVEIMKALWEGEDYLRIPTARRVWGTDWCDREKFYGIAKGYADLVQAIQSVSVPAGQIITIMDFKRGVWALIVGQTQLVDRIIVKHFIEKAKGCFLYFVGRRENLAWLKDIIIWEI